MTASPTLALLKGAKAPPPPASAEEVLGGPTTAIVAATGKGKKVPAKSKVKNDVTVLKAVDGEVMGPDLLVTTANEIENLTEADANTMVTKLTDTSDFNNFKLGGVLSKIFAEKWFAGYPDFKTYVSEVHGFKVRKAFYLVGNYKGLIDLNLTWDKLAPVGWSKLKELVAGDAPIINSGNAEFWLGKATEEGMTVSKLNELVTAAKNEGQLQIGDNGEEKEVFVKKSFSVAGDANEIVDAAIAKAKAVSGTEFDGKALEYMASDYLANSEKVGGAGDEIEAPVKDMTAAAAKKWMLKAGVDVVLELVGELFPDLETVNFKGEEAQAA